jgi:uncharacterized membrane protein YphA (DoxX/SURF4 family)
MRDNSLLTRLLSTRVTRTSEAGIAATRVALGLLVATLHGWHKVEQGWHHLIARTDWPLLHDTVQLGFPLPVVFATFAAVGQFFGGWLLALGAGTRIAALLLATTMWTAVVFNVRTGGPDAQLAGLYALATSAFVLAGGGRWSVDRRLAGH